MEEKKSWNKEKALSEWSSELGNCLMSIEISKNCEKDIEEIIEQFKGLLSAIGYGSETIEEAFG
jgi:hypothetical protein